VESHSSPLILRLAADLARLHAGRVIDITPQIGALLCRLTNLLIPPLDLPRMDEFSPEILRQSLVIPFRYAALSNPELLHQYFDFLSQMFRDSAPWNWELVERWMLCILVSLGNPEGGMSFSGAVNFLVPSFPSRLFNRKEAFLEKMNGDQPPVTLVIVFEYYREVILAQIIWVCIPLVMTSKVDYFATSFELRLASSSACTETVAKNKTSLSTNVVGFIGKVHRERN